MYIKNLQDLEENQEYRTGGGPEVQIKNLQENEKKLKYEWTARFTKLSEDSRRQLNQATKTNANERLTQVKALHQEKLAVINKKFKASLSKQRTSVATSPHRPVASQYEHYRRDKGKTQSNTRDPERLSNKAAGHDEAIACASYQGGGAEKIIKSLRIREGEIRLNLDHWKLSHNTVQRELQKKTMRSYRTDSLRSRRAILGSSEKHR